MGTPQRPSDALVHALGRQFFLGRSTRFVPERHAVLHGPLYLERLEGFAPKTAAERALRGRLLRLAGRLDDADKELAAALKKDPDCADALAWSWELRDAAKARAPAELLRACRLAPRDGWKRLWLALATAQQGLVPASLADSEAAGELLKGDAAGLATAAVIPYRLKRWGDAVARLDRALALDPSLEWAWRLRGICKHELGDAAGCLADCVEAMRLDENSGLLFVMFGLHKQKTDTRTSIERATAHLARRPKDYWAYVFRADNRRSPEIGENMGAIEDLRRAAELEPRLGLVWAYLSRCQVTQGDFRAAGDSIERAVKLDPSCGWIRAWQGEFLRRAGDPARAVKALDRAVELFPDYELAYAWRGSARRLLGDADRALEDLNAAIRLRPHTLDLCHFERMQTLRALGRAGEALEDVMRASRLNPKYAWETQPERFGAGLAELDRELSARPRSALAYHWRGDLRMRMRDFARAEKDLSRALEIKGCPDEALILRGRCRGELGRWKGALADFDAAVARAPESPFGWAWRGRARMLLGRHAAAVKDFERALERERNSAWLLAWKGEAELKMRKLSAAEASLTRAIEVHAKFADAYLWRGAARLARGDGEAAAADLDRALALKPDSAPALYYRAKALILGRRHEAARADLARALRAPDLLSPAEIRDAQRILEDLQPAKGLGGLGARAEQARAWQREGRHEEAADVYSKLIAARPADVDLRRLRAEAYRCLGRYDLAVQDLDVVVERRPQSPEALAARVELKRHLRDFAGGLRDAEAALSLDGGSAAGWVLRAECLRSLGRFDEAAGSATKAIERDAGWSWAYVVRAKARRQKGELDQALADTVRGEKAAPAPDAYVHGWRGEILRKLGRLSEALPEVVRASTLQPANAWLLALRGQIQVELGQADKGLEDVQQAVRLDPRCSCEYDFLGAEGETIRNDASYAWVYALRGGAHRAADRLDAARADLDRAVSLAPRCAWIRAWRGELLVQQGEWGDGAAELERALKRQPRYAQAWVWRGQALAKAGKPAPALDAFTKALALEPNNVWGLIGRGVCLEQAGRAEEAARALARAQELAPALFSGAPK